ncbi:hypothetical protein FLONG3_1505 [Fusarium longipes]|uniref:Uncharacterized protein n=1 Tax=Fusarium longipes TaxID=694270 RepID=A0A395T7F1_9HYPO|nr:hypothetical protein FLONG3_1505 [Fusarium longipes]
MPPQTDVQGVKENSPMPEGKVKSPQNQLMTPMPTQSQELETNTKTKRRRKKKGNNWTRRKHLLRSPTQLSNVLPSPSPEIKQDEHINYGGLEVKAPSAPGGIYADTDMDIRRVAVERDFGLRPSLGIMGRTQLPNEVIEEADEDVTKDRAPEPSPSGDSPSPDTTPIRPNTCRKEARHILPKPSTPEHSRSPSTSPTTHQSEPAPLPNNTPAKRRRSNESQNSDEGPILPPHFPPNPISRPDRAADIFWRNACLEVQHPDGTVLASEVITRLMTRKGGIANPWPRLEEGLAAVERMGKETLDPAEVLRRHEEEEAIARAKEERRQANKRRYRRRGRIDRERAAQRAAVAAQKVQELGDEVLNKSTQEDDVDDIEENPVKKAKKETPVPSSCGSAS